MADTSTPTSPPSASASARTGGRSGRSGQRSASAAPRRPYITRRIGTFNILDEEGLSLIEANADRLLEGDRHGVS